MSSAVKAKLAFVSLKVEATRYYLKMSLMAACSHLSLEVLPLAESPTSLELEL